MLHKNTHTDPVTITADVLAPEAWTSAGAKPQTVTVPPGGIVDVRRAYGVRRRTSGSNPMELPSTISKLTGGKLQPHGKAALDEFQLFHDQLPEVVLAHVRDAQREDGVSARPDPHAAARKEAEEFGRRMLSAMGEQSQKQAQPVILTAEECPAD